MSRNAKILIDLAVLAAVYGIWLLPKWRPLGRRTLAVYTLSLIHISEPTRP